jgi:putative transposase
MDNIMVERLWRRVNYEEIYPKDYDTVEQLIEGLRSYFRFYNNERPHKSLRDKTPAKVYFGSMDVRTVA